MSLVVELAPPPPGHPAAVAAAVHEALDHVDADGVPADQLAATVAEWERALHRMAAIKLRLLAAAERSTVAEDARCASTGAWLSRQTRTGTAAAAREVSTEHAAVIAQAASRLPRHLTGDQRARVEDRLVEQARRVDPTQLRRLARRALAAVEPDPATVDAHEDAQLVEEESAAVAKTRLTLHDNGDGTLSGHFTVPLLAGSILRKVLDSLTAPRRGRLGATTAQAGDQTRDRDWAHERGLAFTQLLEHLPTDRLHGKVAATVVVTLDADSLTDRLKAAGLDTGDLVSAGQARRLACQAGLVPAVLNGASQPLDLGRSQRLFTEAQRVAGATRHTSCAADGCDVPYAWTELHHATPWSRGGRTDLGDMVPLCGFHHRRIHDPGHLHRRLPDGSIRFNRRT
ncbi:HNH endonuclease signature motif containing protein [Nocardioides coralli]|uniref:HNH endonuclease signature motif containing protein n=1 Tax=Nocardioides coralli TaxID=2872154 RepID=UPI001CA3CF1D|nr:HNH endonuclease signature motif containing protein [Nocardioides coralli]QZY28448.1 HNH endonuclease [Nocardioides coralli]